MVCVKLFELGVGNFHRPHPERLLDFHDGCRTFVGGTIRYTTVRTSHHKFARRYLYQIHADTITEIECLIFRSQTFLHCRSLLNIERPAPARSLAGFCQRFWFRLNKRNRSLRQIRDDFRIFRSIRILSTHRDTPFMKILRYGGILSPCAFLGHIKIDPGIKTFPGISVEFHPVVPFFQHLDQLTCTGMKF